MGSVLGNVFSPFLLGWSDSREKNLRMAGLEDKSLTMHIFT